MADKTLQELAAEQSSNPDNPYLVASNTPPPVNPGSYGVAPTATMDALKGSSEPPPAPPANPSQRLMDLLQAGKLTAEGYDKSKTMSDADKIKFADQAEAYAAKKEVNQSNPGIAKGKVFDVPGAKPYSAGGGATTSYAGTSAVAGAGTPPYDKFAEQFAGNAAPTISAEQQQANDLENTRKTIFGSDKTVAGQFGAPDQVTHTPGLVDLETERKKQEAAAQLDFAAEMKRIDAESVSAQDQRDAKLAADRADAANMKIDPSRFYKKIGTVGTIAAAIAEGAGAFGAALTHTPNFAVDIINKAVDRDVESQREEIASKWKNVEIEGDDNKQKYIREQGARKDMLELRMMQHQSALDEINALAGQTNNAMAQAQLGKMSVEIQKEMQATRDQVTAIRQNAKIKDYQAAQAAANQNPFSNKKLMERAVAIQTDEQKAYQANPAKAGKPRSIEQILNDIAPQSMGGTGGYSGQAGASAATQTDTAVKNLTNVGTEANKGGGVLDVALSELPSWVAPQANSNMNKYDVYNNTTLPAELRIVGERMGPEQLDKLTESLKINPLSSDEFNAQKIKEAQRIVQNLAAIKKTTGTPVETTSGE